MMHKPREGYKQTKVGVIPEEWEVVKLRDIVKVSQGLQIPISSRFGEPSENRVFYITIPYIEGKKVEYIEDARKSILCTKDDLLVVRTGSGAGKIIKNVEGAFHNNFFKLKLLTDLDSNFMYAYLINPRTQFLMNTYAGSSAIPDLNHGDFYSLDFLLPPLKEQQKIAQILSTWDSAISKQEALIKAKEQFKKGLMQKLLSGEVRFEGFDGEWEDVRLGDVATFHKGKGISKNDISDTGIECIRYGELFREYGEVILDIKSKTKNVYKMILSENNDTLMPTSDVTPTGLATASALSKKGVILGGDILIIRTEKINNIFLSYYIRSHKKDIMKLVTGVTVYHIYASDLKTLKILLPPLKEQQKIAQVLSTADEEIELLKNELEALKEQKRGLMQRLLSGDVRVVV